MTTDAATSRLQLWRAGYAPLPLMGKRPAFDKWSMHLETTRDEIALWDQLYPYARNTGILTRLTPTIDIDITDPAAAEAVENLARERFEERGYVLVRIGKAPKRAIPLRTDNPFPKITRNITAPNGTEHKIELLCDGQQVVCFGDHPDTKLPYSWHGGQLGTIKHEDLPYVSREEAAQFVEDALALLVQQFAFKVADNRPPPGATREAGGGHADWAWLVGNINAGRELHDSSVALASKLIVSGMIDGAAVNLLRSLLELSSAPRDGRWQDRYHEIPGDVESARAKFGGIAREPQQINGHDKAPPIVVAPSEYVMPDPATLPPRGTLYGRHYMRGVATSTVAPGGFGKTSLAIYESLEMVKKGLTVWYVSAEDDRTELDRRIAGYAKHHGITPSELANRFFVDDKLTFPFKIARTARAGGVLFDDGKLDSFEAAIELHKIDVVIFDPFISFHYLPENDTAAMDALVKRLGDICARRQMCIELPHHVRKRPSGGGDITVDDARGAGAIVNAVRSCRVINIMSKIEAEQAEIDPDKRAFYLRIDSGKSNMAPPAKARWLHLASVEIANGDQIGVIEPWEFPKVFGKVSTADVDWVRELVRASVYRADSRSPEWLGHELAERFGRSAIEQGDIKWINAVLSTWVRNGVIGKERRPDQDRKARMYFVPVGGGTVVPFKKPHDEKDGDDD